MAPPGLNLPDYRCEPGRLAAHRSLFAEHLETAAFLYEHRLARLAAAPGIDSGWRAVRALEERLENHVDALFLGRDTALEVCAEHCGEEAEPGELFVALSVFCRRGDVGLAAAALRTLDHADPARVLAAERALSLELPKAWVPFVAEALRAGRPGAVALMAGVCGYRRLPLGDELRAAFAAVPSDRLRVADALGRVGAVGACLPLLACLGESDPALQAAALRALGRLGDVEGQRVAASEMRHRDWPLLGLALAADRETAHDLQEVAARPGGGRDAVWALGLAGIASGFDVLCDALERPEQAAFAAQALHWMTGASVVEETFLPERVDEAGLFPDELRVWLQDGVAPARADGRPFGEQVRRLSVDPARWRAWLLEHGALDARIRWRGGVPHGAAALLDCLEDDHSDAWIRAFAAEELAVRFACPIAFEPDMPVRLQCVRLAQMRTWLASNPPVAAPGSWAFAGRAL